MPTIEQLETRIAALEEFLIRNSHSWDESDIGGMLLASSLREAINDTVAADCYVTASLSADN